MRLNFQIDDAQIAKMKLTIAITMTVEEWRVLMRQQGTSWPTCDLGREIATALGHIRSATEATIDQGSV